MCHYVSSEVNYGLLKKKNVLKKENTNKWKVAELIAGFDASNFTGRN